MAYPTPTDSSNPAARISRLVARALSAGHSNYTVDVWAIALGLPVGGTGFDSTHRVAHLLGECIEEARTLRRAMEQMGVPEGLYEPYVARVEKLFAFTGLHATWNSTINHFAVSEVMLALAWCSHVLPEDDDAVSADDLAELAGLLGELEEALQAPGLPEVIRAAFAKHLAGMKRALELVPVRGAKPMKIAARAILADLNIDKDEIRAATTAENAPAVKQLGGKFHGAYKKAVEVAGDVDKIMKVGKPLLEWVKDAMDQI
jgi:hypothetical protein